MAVEAVAIAVGKTVGGHAGSLWLAGRQAKAERKKDLVELIQLRFPDRIVRRRVERQLEEIADSVAERVIRLCGHEYAGLQENDKAAALAEVVAALEAADLSDESLFGVDVDPMRLARDVRAAHSRDAVRLLGEAGGRLFEVVLEECCDCLIQIVRHLPQFGPRASVEMLARMSGLSAMVTDVLARLPARTLDAPEGSADDEEFHRRYLEHVSRTFDTIELFGVRIERYRPRTTLSVAYISLSVSSDVVTARGLGEGRIPGAREMAIADWRGRDQEAEPATVRVETALGHSRLLLVRGEAGAGKSTLLRWLAVSAVRGTFTGDLAGWNGCTPFLIKLRSHIEGGLPTPERFLDGVADPIGGLMPKGWVHRRLSTRRALILIDGIDELPAGRRQAVRPWLSALLAAYPEIRVVVTSRPAAAGARWLAAEGFSTAFLERMSPADTKALIQHWHAAIRDGADLPCPQEKLPGYEAALLARLEAAPNLRVLAASPLLAAMLCALNLDRATRLPRDRMELYAAVLELLLERRDAERDIPSYLEIGLEREPKIQILQDLAWRLSTTSRTELPKTTALRRVEEKLRTMPRVTASGEQVLEHLLHRSGVLREPVPGRIDFVHRTVQEYLTAKQAADDGDVEPLIAYAHRDQWRETIVMAAGHANAPLRQELIAGLLGRIAREPRRARTLKLLLVACLETLPTVPLPLADAVDECVGELVPPRDVNSARSLASAGESILNRLPRSLDGLTAAAARATVRTAWLINGPEALDLLTGYGADPRPEVQKELIEGWSYFDPEEYTCRVLADAPLVSGCLDVPSVGVLPYVRHLRHVEGLYAKAAPDLSFLADVRPLKGISATVRDAEDLEALEGHMESLRYFSLQTEGSAVEVSRLGGLCHLDYLRLVGPDFSSIEFVGNLPQLDELTLSWLGGVDDFTPLRGQISLRVLGLYGCESLVDLYSLPPLGKLTRLNITCSRLSCGLDQVTAAAPKVTDLNLSLSGWVDDISPLAGLPMRFLYLGGCGSIQDFSPLALCGKLQTLGLSDTKIADLTVLDGLRHLRALHLRGCGEVRDLAPLAGLPNLRNLYISNIADGVDVAPLVANSGLTVHIAPGQELRNKELLGGRIREEER